jgi:hypothetical protein
MTLQVKGGARERLSYRTLDVEQIGSVYETVMGFMVETAAERSIAIKAGKHNRTPVFVNLEKLAAAKGRERIKFLKEEAERGQLSVSVAKAVEAATGESSDHEFALTIPYDRPRSAGGRARRLGEFSAEISTRIVRLYSNCPARGPVLSHPCGTSLGPRLALRAFR